MSVRSSPTACDAITKLHKLEVMGEYAYPDGHKDSIQVIVNPEEKTLKFIDTGLGMTADEVEEYITQIAFSGATAFLEKYKDKTNKDEIIGHFGLGFYSVFMVSDNVEIDTLSFQKDASLFTGNVTEAPNIPSETAPRPLWERKSPCT